MAGKTRKEIVDQRREQLIDAAYVVVSKQGFSNFTVRDIAKEANLSTGLVHYYFKDKEDLLLNLLKEINNNLKKNTVAALAETEDSEEKLRIYLDLAFGQVVEEKEFYYVLIDFWSQANRNVRMKKTNIKLLNSYHSMCAGILEEGVTKGSFPEMDISYTASVILSLVQGVIVRYVIDDKAFEYGEYVDRVTEHIIDMVLKK
ncbi:MAG: TetR/AcrR family transcriptional regulator [bacterium]|nr:TetR/AcrR family transcriptional regulator [bacterium]